MHGSRVLHNLIVGILICLIMVFTILRISSLSRANKNRRSSYIVSIIGSSMFIIAGIVGLIIWNINY